MDTSEPGNDYESAIQYLCSRLELPPAEQDWGLVAADPHRVSCFVRFYQENAPFSYWKASLLGDLIFASVDRAVAESIETDDAVATFLRWLDRARGEQSENIAYWEKYFREIEQEQPDRRVLSGYLKPT
jgi:hypothetical protein